MLAFRIKDVKHFMSRLLRSADFDSFLLVEAVVSTYNTFTIDGRLNRAFFSREEWEDPAVCSCEFSSLETLRPLLFELMKGNKTPVGFKLILHLHPRFVPDVLKPSETSLTADQVKALVLTCKYEAGTLTLITGTALHTFLPDKSAEVLWDNTLKAFLTRKGFDWETL